MTTMQNLRELLAVHMEIHNMDGVEVGRLINLNRVHVYKFLRGEQGLNGERVLKLLDLLGFEVVKKPEPLDFKALREMLGPCNEKDELAKALGLYRDTLTELDLFSFSDLIEAWRRRPMAPPRKIDFTLEYDPKTGVASAVGQGKKEGEANDH